MIHEKMHDSALTIQSRLHNCVISHFSLKHTERGMRQQTYRKERERERQQEKGKETEKAGKQTPKLK